MFAASGKVHMAQLLSHVLGMSGLPCVISCASNIAVIAQGCGHIIFQVSEHACPFTETCCTCCCSLRSLSAVGRCCSPSNADLAVQQSSLPAVKLISVPSYFIAFVTQFSAVACCSIWFRHRALSKMPCTSACQALCLQLKPRHMHMQFQLHCASCTAGS